MFQAAFCLAFMCFLCSGKLGKRLPHLSSLLAQSNLHMTVLSQPSSSHPARPTQLVAALPSQHQPSLIEHVLSKHSRSSAKSAHPLPCPSLSKTASLLPEVCSLTPCPAASLLAAYHPGAILGIHSNAGPLPGWWPTMPAMLPSKGSDAGTVTASGNMLTSQRLIVQQLQQWLCTKMLTNPSASPLLPGTISDLPTCPSRVGLPLASLQFRVRQFNFLFLNFSAPFQTVFHALSRVITNTCFFFFFFFNFE
ncbi:uncharacterized protein UDID_19216 [Ustilago sp. UG-2017a]|nr:uncharacterized protein UDID_19216 [Ustilago sp. UG-2017a]